MTSDTGGGQANERTAEMGNYIPWPGRMWGECAGEDFKKWKHKTRQEGTAGDITRQQKKKKLL